MPGAASGIPRKDFLFVAHSLLSPILFGTSQNQDFSTWYLLFLYVHKEFVKGWQNQEGEGSICLTRGLVSVGAAAPKDFEKTDFAPTDFVKSCLGNHYFFIRILISLSIWVYIWEPAPSLEIPTRPLFTHQISGQTGVEEPPQNLVSKNAERTQNWVS